MAIQVHLDIQQELKMHTITDQNFDVIF